MSHTKESYNFDSMDVAEKGTDTTGSNTGVDVKYGTEKRPSKSSMVTKALAFLLLAALIAVVVVLVMLLVKEKDDDSDDDHKIEPTRVCTTADCVSTAARVQASMALQADPCEDFYQFACGGWREERVMPDDKSTISTITALEDKVAITLKNILETKSSNEDPGYIRKARDFYASCMDTELLETKGGQPLKDLLAKELGSWPLLMRQGEWNEDDFDIVDMAKKVFTLGSSAHFKLFVFNDYRGKDSTRLMLMIDKAPLSMSDKVSGQFYLVPRNDTLLMAYEEKIRSTAMLLGADEATARGNAKEIVDFEIQLANISATQQRSDITMTLEDLHKEYQQAFGWKSFIQELLGMDGVDLSIGDQEPIMNIFPNFFKHWKLLLDKTPKRVQANYMVWRVVNDLMHTLSDKYRQVQLKYNSALVGVKRQPYRYRTCVDLTAVNNMGLAVSQLYIKDSFDVKSKSEILESIGNIQNAFDELLDDLDWMDEDTRRVAKEKNHAIDKKIGYPEDITNNTIIENVYENFTYTRHSFFKNVLNQRKEKFKSSLRSLHKSLDKRDIVWRKSPPAVSAMHDYFFNQIVFPAGILQTPFFSSSSPKSLNYGGIGFVIGHEITHGFDVRGRHYDKDGKVSLWWNRSTIDKFIDVTKCLAEQYSNFTMKEVNMNVNGLTTLSDNIADIGGLRQSFKAYRNWVAAQGKEEMPLPGLDFTHNQLFFLGFAQVWCEKQTDEQIIHTIKTDEHSPSRYRVIGPLQNSPEFSEAFNCKPESVMNKKNKCRVW